MRSSQRQVRCRRAADVPCLIEGPEGEATIPRLLRLVDRERPAARPRPHPVHTGRSPLRVQVGRGAFAGSGRSRTTGSGGNRGGEQVSGDRVEGQSRGRAGLGAWGRRGNRGGGQGSGGVVGGHSRGRAGLWGRRRGAIEGSAPACRRAGEHLEGAVSDPERGVVCRDRRAAMAGMRAGRLDEVKLTDAADQDRHALWTCGEPKIGPRSSHEGERPSMTIACRIGSRRAQGPSVCKRDPVTSIAVQKQ